MNLTIKQAEAAEWLIKYAADYPGMAQRKLAEKTPLHYNVFTRLMYSCGHRSWPEFLQWCALGMLKQLIRGGDCEDITPEDLRAIENGLRQHRVVAAPCTRTRHSLRGSCCAKCGGESRLLKRGAVVLCAECAGIRRRARVSWNPYTGEEIDYSEQKTALEPLDGSRLRKESA